MNACLNPNTATADDRLEASLEGLHPQVGDLVARVSNVEPTMAFDENGIRLTSPLVFPDGVGEGAVSAELFRYRDAVRLDVRIEHNRVFAAPNGEPTERRCFLNDYIASVTVEAGTDTIPTEFVRSVVSGVAAARDAVRRHNKQAQAPWNEIRVAAQVPEPVA